MSIHVSAEVHPSAVVEPGALIGSGCKIGPFCWIGSNVHLAERVSCASHVVIKGQTKIGSDTKVFSFAVIGEIPQDLKFNGESSLAIIGDNTVIRECATINRATSATGRTIVGENCLIMAYAHVAHDCVIGDYAIIVNNVALGGHVNIGKYSIIGGLSAVHQFVNIGEHCMISGGSLVRKDVPPFVKAGREPLSFIGINSIGLRRRGFDEKEIEEIQNIYRFLYQKNYNNSQAINKIEVEFKASKLRDKIISFVQSSVRGIMRGYN